MVLVFVGLEGEWMLLDLSENVWKTSCTCMGGSSGTGSTVMDNTSEH